jgi:hypothetical protein
LSVITVNQHVDRQNAIDINVIVDRRRPFAGQRVIEKSKADFGRCPRPVLSRRPVGSPVAYSSRGKE